MGTFLLERCSNSSSISANSSLGSSANTATVPITSSISVSQLLYNLQIVELLVQPASDTAKLNELIRINYFDDIDSNLLLSWPKRFLSKGGYKGVHMALRIVSELMSEYAQGACMH